MNNMVIKMKIFFTIVYILFCAISLNSKTKHEIVFETKESYSFAGYYTNSKNNFIVRLADNKKRNFNFYILTNYKLVKINNSNLIKEKITKINLRYDLNKIRNKYPNNKKIKSYLSGAIKHKGGQYVVSLESGPWHESLYLFKNNKLENIDLGKINPLVGYGGTSLYYDSKYEKLYFSGVEKNREGLYVYDFITRKTKILHQEKEYLVLPYKIKNTNKIIYMTNNSKNFKIYLRDIEK